MSFADIQTAYAAHRVATYPLSLDKTPAVKAAQPHQGAIRPKLISRFPDATAGGFCAGARNKLTVVDIDSTDDRLVDEIQARFGATPLHVRTPSGGRHLYYRHAGEARRIKPLPAVDVLGGGERRRCALCCAQGALRPGARHARCARHTASDAGRGPAPADSQGQAQHTLFAIVTLSWITATRLTNSWTQPAPGPMAGSMNRYRMPKWSRPRTAF